MMFLTRIKLAAILLLAIVLIGGGGVASYVLAQANSTASPAALVRVEILQLAHSGFHSASYRRHE